MSNETNGQVELETLLFAQSWEDPRSDRAALAIKPNDRIVTITSGVCNTLTFLLDDPSEIIAIDINRAQTHLAELKIAAIRELDHSAFLEFIGLESASKKSTRPSSAERWKTYQKLRSALTPEAQRFWDTKQKAIQAGILTAGKYESFISLFRILVRILQGRSRIEGLFQQPSLEAQRQYFDKTWDSLRWRAIFKLFFNKRVLARRGLDAQYFKFDDGSHSFAESFYRRTRHTMREMPARTNYFLASYMLGGVSLESEVSVSGGPEYLLPGAFALIKSRVDRITFVTADLKKWLALQPDRSIDGFSLSNICELMDDADTYELFSQVARTGRVGAGICFRNLMVPRGVPKELASKIRRDDLLSKQLLAEDRSFVYGKVDAMEVTE